MRTGVVAHSTVIRAAAIRCALRLAILKLRALHANGDFDRYWAYHLRREHQRNHPGTYTLAA